MHKIKINFIKHQRAILLILLFFVVGTMTIGYANFQTILTLGGTVSIRLPEGEIKVTTVAFNIGEGVTPSEPIINNNNVTFVDAYSSATGTATYIVTIKNNSDSNYIYNGYLSASNTDEAPTQVGEDLIMPEFTITPTISNIIPGDVIGPNEEKEIIVTMVYSGNNTNPREIETYMTFNFETNPTGELSIDLSTESLDFRANTTNQISLYVVNSLASERYVEYRINNNNFELVDQNGVALATQTYNANYMNNETIYLKVKDNVVLNEDQTVTLTYYVNGSSESLGTISLDCIDFTVTFNAKDGTIPSGETYIGSGATVTKGYANNDLYGTLPIPTRDGYTFDGWYADEIPEIVLPSEYTKLEYIYNTANGPYINLNYVATLNTKAIVKLAKRNTTAGANLWGSRGSSASQNVFGIISFGATQKVTPQMNGSTGDWVREPYISTNDTSPHVYFISNGLNGIDQGISLSGTYTQTPEATGYNNTYSLYAAGAFNGQGKPEQLNPLDQYYMIFWEGTTLDSYYVPCTRLIDNSAGLCKTLPITSSGLSEVEFYSSTGGVHNAGTTTDLTAKESTSSSGTSAHTLYAKWIQN